MRGRVEGISVIKQIKSAVSFDVTMLGLGACHPLILAWMVSYISDIKLTRGFEGFGTVSNP